MISSADIRGVFTKKLSDVYQERVVPKDWFQSFFIATPPSAKTVSIEVQRGFEYIAVDVVRGTEGNRNQWSKSNEKIWEPPFYKEYLDITEFDEYDRVLGSEASDNSRLFTALMNKTVDRLGELQDKISRAKELQCSQVLFDGIVTLNAGTDIDFKRKADSKVDLGGAGGYWSVGATNPFDQLGVGCKFLREVGKSTDFEYVGIFGESAFAAFQSNTTVLARQNLFNMKLDNIQPPQLAARGATFHGTITVGVYRLQVWTYADVYDTATAEHNQYVPTKKVTIIPQRPRFKMAHALVPQLIRNPGEVPAQGEWVLRERLDENQDKHIFDIQTACLAVPVAVDQIWTGQALA